MLIKILFLDFPGACFASTECKTYPVNGTWSLAPFCGQSACIVVKSQKTGKIYLAEQVRITE